MKTTKKSYWPKRSVIIGFGITFKKYPDWIGAPKWQCSIFQTKISAIQTSKLFRFGFTSIFQTDGWQPNHDDVDPIIGISENERMQMKSDSGLTDLHFLHLAVIDFSKFEKTKNKCELIRVSRVKVTMKIQWSKPQSFGKWLASYWVHIKPAFSPFGCDWFSWVLNGKLK